jgi:twitching motility protein PilT
LEAKAVARIDNFLRFAVEKNASDLHLCAGLVPKIRITGDLVNVGDTVISPEEAQAYLLEILEERQKNIFLNTGDLDFIYSVDGVGRFRTNYYKHQRGLGGAFRVIPALIKTVEELNLPPVIKKFAELRSGLVLVTGPTGCGKSTTLASLIDYINENFRRHVITLEDPIEYIHLSNKKSIINQRQVMRETQSFMSGLRASIHQDPEVLMVGEMRDYETIRLVLEAVETGILVFATLHTNSAEKTLNRIVDVFPGDEQSQIRALLSESLNGVIAQLLLRTYDGTGRLPACEILIATTGVTTLLRQGRVAEIVSLMQTGRSSGMQTMDDSLYELASARRVRPEEAFAAATNKRRFEPFLKKTAVIVEKKEE